MWFNANVRCSLSDGIWLSDLWFYLEIWSDVPLDPMSKLQFTNQSENTEMITIHQIAEVCMTAA